MTIYINADIDTLDIAAMFALDTIETILDEELS
jgi:hypothetical protein